MKYGGFNGMWIFAMFDLPTDTKKARKNYREFRDKLLGDGFAMLQYSVYARYCASTENTVVHRQRVKNALPPDGEIRLVTITDKQFEKMQIFHGKTRKATEKAPSQLSFF
jgi:CRISPR-associated protein Cas2